MEFFAGRVILLWGWRRWLAAMMAGAIASLALAPFDFPAAGFVAFPVLIWLLDGATGSGGVLGRLLPFFVTGWCFGLGCFLAGSWWIALFLFSTNDWVTLIPAAVGSAAALASSYGLATLLARFLWSDGLGRIFALAFTFAVVEWLRLTFVPGLAWNAIGSAIMPLPILMQAVQIIGMAGMSAAAVFIFSVPALLGTRRQMIAGLSLAAILIALQVGYGYYRLSTVPPPNDMLQARLVQPSDVGAGGPDQSLRAYAELSSSEGAANPPRLILWPEQAIPLVLTERGDILAELGRVIEDGQVLVVGTLRRAGASSDISSKPRDAVAVIDDRGEITDVAGGQAPSLFARDRLFWWFPWAAGSSAESGRYILQIAEGTRAVPLIGSEVLRSDSIPHAMEDAAIILNPAGYPAFVGEQPVYQHLRQAQFRAAEARLPLLLSMQNGISAAIDSQGRVLDAFRPGAYGALDILVPLTERKIVTPGNNFPSGLTFVVFFGILALLSSIHERLI